MSSRQIIFLGGVHGTGKGNFCNRLCNISRWQYLSASELLKWSDYVSDPRSKRVRDIQETQARLLAGLEHACKPDGHYVLDGHFTLLDGSGHITRIELATFEAIQPRAILVKTERASVVRDRLRLRDGRAYSIALIDKMLADEAAYSTELARHFNVPHFLIEPEREEEVLKAVATLK